MAPNSTITVWDAIGAISSELGSLERDADNPYFKSKYVSLPALLQTLRPHLKQHNCALSSQYEQLPSGLFAVVTTVVHIPSQTSRISRFPFPDCSKAQAVGGVGTYGLRYNLMQLFCLAAEDADGNDVDGLAGQYAGPPPDGGQRSAPSQVPAYPAAPPPWMQAAPNPFPGAPQQ